MKQGSITVDKLYLLARLVREVRKNVSDEENRRKLQYWFKLLNSLLESNGDTLLPKLRRMLARKDEDLTEEVKQMFEALEQ